MHEGKNISMDLTRIIDILAENDCGRVWFVIRHAEKAPLDPCTSFEKVSLTLQGVNDSIELGHRLRDAGIKLSSMVSSPLTRCTQTCDNIVKGHGDVITVQKEDALAYPGSLLEYTETCHRNLSKGVSNVLNLILNQEPIGNSVCIVVTHDAVIAPLLTFLNGETFDRENKWIGYLDGFVLCNTHENWKVIDGRGMVHEVTPHIKLIRSI